MKKFVVQVLIFFLCAPLWATEKCVHPDVPSIDTVYRGAFFRLSKFMRDFLKEGALDPKTLNQGQIIYYNTDESNKLCGSVLLSANMFRKIEVNRIFEKLEIKVCGYQLGSISVIREGQGLQPSRAIDFINFRFPHLEPLDKARLEISWLNSVVNYKRTSATTKLYAHRYFSTTSGYYDFQLLQEDASGHCRRLYKLARNGESMLVESQNGRDLEIEGRFPGQLYGLISLNFLNDWISFQYYSYVNPIAFFRTLGLLDLQNLGLIISYAY